MEKTVENTRYNILLIEDDKLDQEAFTRLVEDQGLPYDCKVAGSISEARSILGREGFDVIITDYSLGDGTACEIFAIVKNTPIILITGTEEVVTNTLSSCVCNVLVKDMARSYLKVVPITIENAVKGKRSEVEL
jgi:DNA-binding NtrC family response regulator